MENRAVVILNLEERGETYDIDIPLDLTASELLEGLSTAFSLGIDVDDAVQCYVKVENPVAFMHGRKSLAEFGVMNGSIITI